jgi:hypothetical protein
VPIAAMASRDNPVRAGLAAIRHRPLAYLLRIVVTIVVAGVLFVLVVLASFFIGGWIATAMTVTVVGLVVWWLTRLWARAFERARAGTISV